MHDIRIVFVEVVYLLLGPRSTSPLADISIFRSKFGGDVT